MEETYSRSSISSLDSYLYVMKSEFEELKEAWTLDHHGEEAETSPFYTALLFVRGNFYF